MRDVPRPLAGSRLLLAAVLGAAPALSTDEDFSWEAPDGSFPDHSGCAYVGTASGLGPSFSAVRDFAASKKRTEDTLAALSIMPEPRRGGVFADSLQLPSGDGGPCGGIDDCIRKTADLAGVPLTYLTTDAEFLRRARLDLTGRIPRRAEVEAFVADTSADKRERLVEDLLQTPEWADRWAMFFGDLFRNTIVTPQVNRYQASRDSFHLYLLESLQANKPYDRMAREMLAAQGTSDGRTYPRRYTSYQHFQSTYGDYAGNPVTASAVAYAVGARTIGGPIQDTYDTLAFVTARDFLGISAMDCVLCHDGKGHLEALSVWGTGAKRLEGWGLAAFFSDIPRYQAWRVPNRTLPKDPRSNRTVRANYYRVQDLRQGWLTSTDAGDTAGMYLAQTAGGNRPDRLHQQREVLPEYPFEGNAVVNPSLRLREQVGLHLTADPQFARAAVNYIWRQFFSRGIVEPPDQFDLARLDPGSPPPEGWDLQPSHPHLLEWLAKGFRASGFDLKWLMREIATSQAYQLSSRYEGVFNPLYDRYFVRHQVKRLTAEQVHDAIAVASGRPAYYRISRNLDAMQYAMQFPDVENVPPGNRLASRNVRALLQAFTPGDRDQTQRSGGGSPLQALHLMNNPFVVYRVDPDTAPAGTLAASLEMPDDALVASLYLHALSRYPTEEELAYGVGRLGRGDRAEQASDLMWSLFNKTDFYFNY